MGAVLSGAGGAASGVVSGAATAGAPGRLGASVYQTVARNLLLGGSTLLSNAYYVTAALFGFILSFLIATFLVGSRAIGGLFGAFLSLSNQANFSSTVASGVSNGNVALWYIAYVCLRIPFLLIYVVVRLFKTILRNLLPLLFFLFLTLILLFVEYQSLYMVEFAHISTNIAVTSTNVGLAITNIALDILEFFHIFSLIFIDGMVQAGFIVADNVPSGSTGRRLVAGFASVNLAALTSRLGGARVFVAALYRFSILIQNLMLLVFIIIFGYLIVNFGAAIASTLQVVILQFACASSNPRCFGLEIADRAIAAPLRALTIGIELRCSRSELTGGAVEQSEWQTSCHCASFYTNLDDCTSARVLCAQESDEFCESVNDQKIGCHLDAALGCPLSRRALDPVGHVLNMEELSDCYDVCMNGSSLIRVCYQSYQHLGACGSTPHDNTRRHLAAVFPNVKIPEFQDVSPPRRQLRDTSRAQTASALESVVPLRFTTGDGIQCDLSNGSINPYYQFVDMMCMARYLMKHIDVSSKPWFDTTDMIKTSKWMQTRRLLYDSLSDTDDPMTLFESTATTDSFTLFKPIQSFMYSLSHVHVGGRSLEDMKHGRRRRVDEINNCPSGQQMCPDLLTCVPFGQDSECPNECQVGVLGQIICGVAYANNVTSNFDLGTYIDSAEDCWRNYETNPLTHPLNPSATPETIVYCFPLTPPITYRFPNVEFNLQESVQGCQGSCACPRYYPGSFDYNGRWFDFVTISERDRIFNALIALQWMISRVTVFLYYPDRLWYGFWAIFPLPQWWLRLLGDQVPNPDYLQEYYCVAIHLGSLCYFFLVLTIILIFVVALSPLVYLIIALVQWPFYVFMNDEEKLNRFKDYVNNKTDAMEQSYTEYRLHSLEAKVGATRTKQF